MAIEISSEDIKKITRNMIRTEKESKFFNGDRLKTEYIHFCSFSEKNHNDMMLYAYRFHNDAIIIEDKGNEILHIEVINPNKTKEDIEKQLIGDNVSISENVSSDTIKSFKFNEISKNNKHKIIPSTYHTKALDHPSMVRGRLYHNKKVNQNDYKIKYKKR